MASKSLKQNDVVISPQKDALNRLLASAVGSLFAETATLPTDVIKTRLQLQRLTVKSTDVVYTGMFNAAQNIVKSEGIPGLFKGLEPALLRQVSYSSLAFVVFEPIRDSIAMCSLYMKRDIFGMSKYGTINYDEYNPGLFDRILGGGLAGSFGISIMNPTEVIKTQMQSSRNESKYMSTVIRHVYNNDGIIGFWAGIKPNVTRCFFVNAAEIGSYDWCKHKLYELNICIEGSLISHVLSSFFAGILSASVSTPFDVVKTRLMNESGNNIKQYSGMINGLINIPQNEGITALYKGFIPIVTRKVIFCVVFFVTYENVRSYLGLPTK